MPDLNQDSYNDVVVGAPLEDDHQGAIYIFLGFEETVLKKYKQVQLPGLWSAPSCINQTQREVDVQRRPWAPAQSEGQEFVLSISSSHSH